MTHAEHGQSSLCRHWSPGLPVRSPGLSGSNSGLVMQEVGTHSRGNWGGSREKQQMELPGSSGRWAGGCGHVQSLVSKAHVSEQVTASSTQWPRSLCLHIQICHLILVPGLSLQASGTP